MSKGLAPLIIVAVIAISALAAEYFVVRNLLQKHEVLRRVGLEQEYITALNNIEIFKRFLRPIANFSYCEGDVSGFSSNLKEYANMYGLNAKVDFLSVDEDELQFEITVKAEGSFFEIEEKVVDRFKVSC
jgi:hypothetical protein